MSGYGCFAVEGDREQVSPTYATLAEASAWRAGRGAHHLDVLPVDGDADKFDPSTLAHGGEQYRQREFVGHRATALAQDGPWTAKYAVDDEDRETYAADVISDVLTALFGPAGTTTHDGAITHNVDAQLKAEFLLARALDSYRGDAEDYVTE